MTRVALLIGGSEVASDGVQHNVVDMQQVLQHPDLGLFAEVKTLLDPEPKEIEPAVAALFAEREKHDLVLLYFSGIALKDAQGKLYFSANQHKPTGLHSTTVAASVIQNVMNNSQSERQVLILDCCLGGDPVSWLAANSFGDLKTQLLTPRQVLLSAFTLAPVDEQGNSDLGIYTRYLVEGMKTGTADLDNDGVVSVKELHEYSSQKVQETVSPVQLGIHWVREDVNKLVLTKVPVGDSKLRYRKQIERLTRQNEVMSNNRHTLEALREKLQLLPEEARAIEAGVLHPLQAYQQSPQKLDQTLVPENQQKYPTREITSFQTLGLADAERLHQIPLQPPPTTEEPARIESPILGPSPISASHFAPRATARLWETNLGLRHTPVKVRLLIGLGVASALAMIGMIYGLARLKSTPSASSLEQSRPIPRMTAVPQVPSPTAPSALTPQLPSIEVPNAPPAVPNPSPLVSKPLFPVPKVPLILPDLSPLEPQPTTAKPKAPASKPKPDSTTPQPRPIPEQPSVAVPAPPTTEPEAIVEPEEIAEPEELPTSSTEPSPTSTPESPLPELEELPTSSAEPPPTSAPGSDF